MFLKFFSKKRCHCLASWSNPIGRRETSFNGQNFKNTVVLCLTARFYTNQLQLWNNFSPHPHASACPGWCCCPSLHPSSDSLRWVRTRASWPAQWLRFCSGMLLNLSLIFPEYSLLMHCLGSRLCILYHQQPWSFFSRNISSFLLAYAPLYTSSSLRKVSLLVTWSLFSWNVT